jgi:Na+-translocating ferredoxin:NAD+ oxidoreductase RnfC subunit
MAKAKNRFKGGYRFTYFKGCPIEKIVSIDTPDSVSIPLSRGNGTTAEPLVKKGDEVRAGQVIAEGPFHSPIDGTVTEITDQPAVVVKKPERPLSIHQGYLRDSILPR